jgi:type I restriction-modification system DNA methylase subunit
MTATIEELKEKIELFRKNLKDYKSKNYDEYNTRADFIDVMFSSLGWDMYNEQKIIEQFREVVREDKIIIDGTKKAPDYSFRIGPHIVFYVEAKKPSVDVKNDMLPALQLRRYAHTRGLALSIVTDFEEVAVYDTRIKPDKKDSAAVARVFYCTYDELFLPCKIEGHETNYDFLLNTFGKQAVLNGSFNRYVETNKKGTTSVDKGFLELLNRWRERLAENIALKNDEIDEYNLNIAVQKLIDRLIFLRIAEDRLIEKPDLLKEITHKDNVYMALNNIFAIADLKYNSNLFNSEAWMAALSIEDKVLNEIIDEMYPPKCPYEFSVLPIEILGHAYEQFLGKTIKFSRKTKFGHSIEIEEKPEVRKAGGVYYTPDYIVDYIVENTVGEKINGTGSDGPRTPRGGKADSGVKPFTPEEIASLKILDPACGSGSFLIGAYDYLILYHLEYYLKSKTRRDKAQSAGIIYEAGEGKYKLSTKTKSEILVNNIFGVDIDQQAVEVTKLSLLLKVLEDENLEYKEKLFKTEQLHMLPDLSANIKCGNSLIGSDYYADKNMDLFGSTEMRKVNVFDWEKAFPSATLRERGGKQAGSEVKRSVSEAEPWGFDCVIGNPPYVRQELLGDDFKKYAKKYETYAGTADLYVFFIEKAHKLLKPGGRFGYIVANKWMRANYGQALRRFISSKAKIEKIIDFGELPVFQDASTFPAIVITSNIKPEGKQNFIYAPIKRLSFDNLPAEVSRIGQELSEKALGDDNWILASNESINIIEKMKNAGIPLGEYVEDKIYRGVLTGLNEAFVIDEATKNRLIAEDPKSAEIIKLFANGDDIRKYEIRNKGRYLILIPQGWTNKQTKDKNKWIWFEDSYPAIAKHLKPFHEKAEKRWDKGDYWWELRSCDYYDKFSEPKIVYPDIAKESRFSFDTDCFYITNTAYFIPGVSVVLAAVLNSKAIWFYYKSIAAALGDADKGGRLRFFTQYMLTLPIPNMNTPKLSEAVLIRIESQKQFQFAKIDSDRKILQQKIDAVDSQIDRLVYELYGLSEDEIRIVEGGE